MNISHQAILIGGKFHKEKFDITRGQDVIRVPHLMSFRKSNFDSNPDAATFIVKNKKTKPDMQVYMAMRNSK